MPLYGKEYYTKLIEANRWIKDFLPNFKSRSVEHTPTSSIGLVKKIFERILDFIGGDRLDRFFMNLTDKRWKKIYQHQYEKKDFEIAFKTNSHTSKNHPNYFQKKITELYKERLAAFENQIGITWYE